jgi:hypothetical protein
MPYSAPPQWAHLDYPTAAKLNLYKDGLDAAYALTGSDKLQPAVCHRMATVQGYYLVNRWRWLLYLGAGRIDDPAGVGDEVSLSDTGGWAAYDLLQVDWLHPGRLYQVQDVQCCFEDYESL